MDDLNNGFDAATIPYFNEAQFEIVLQRVKALKAIGVYGIETYKGGKFWTVDTFESYNSYPQNPDWYEAAFEKFKDAGEFMYSASFYVPGNYLEFEE